MCWLLFPVGVCVTSAACTCRCRARADNTLKGLSSYNILQNPRFKTAFAITGTFADRCVLMQQHCVS
jgi:hypothetical protein